MKENTKITFCVRSRAIFQFAGGVTAYKKAGEDNGHEIKTSRLRPRFEIRDWGRKDSQHSAKSHTKLPGGLSTPVSGFETMGTHRRDSIVIPAGCNDKSEQNKLNDKREKNDNVNSHIVKITWR